MIDGSAPNSIAAIRMGPTISTINVIIRSASPVKNSLLTFMLSPRLVMKNVMTFSS
jgi:hypothetical protein